MFDFFRSKNTAREAFLEPFEDLDVARRVCEVENSIFHHFLGSFV